MNAKICSDGKKPKDGKCKTGSVAPIFTSSFEFDTGGKRVNISKIAKGLAKQMNRQYVIHSAEQLKTKVKGKLVTTKKGIRLTDAQKKVAKQLI